jgi:hypothetical protein
MRLCPNVPGQCAVTAALSAPARIAADALDDLLAALR